MAARKPARQAPGGQPQIPRKDGRKGLTPQVEGIKIGNGVGAVPTSAPIEDFAHRPGNPRYDYRDSSGLAATLETAGLKLALSVLPIAVYLEYFPQHAEQLQGAKWVVMDGNRRLAAGRQAGLNEMRMTVDDALASALASGEDPDVAVREATLIANVQSEDLPPLLEAAELRALVDFYGSQRKVAARLGKSQGWISQRLSLLNLSDELKHQLRHGKLAIEDARAVANPKKKGTTQEDMLAEIRKAKSETKAAVKAAKEEEPAPAASAPKLAAVPPPTDVVDQPAAAERPAVKDQPAPKSGPTTILVRVDTMENAAEDLAVALSPDEIAALIERLS